jgi:amidase
LTTDLCWTTAVDLASLIRRHKVSPLEVMQAVLTRIEKVNPPLNAYCTVAAEQALAAAKKATAALGRKSATLGPLHGVPVSIKDLAPTKGIRTTWGSKIFEHHVPDEDALVVERLKAAGAIVVGKTNTPEYGAGANTFNAVFGPTRNPWNPALTCGGSTGGGGVALATGMAPLAQGSDLGGSLRLPAAFCGVVGFRTSPGLIPRYPSVLAWDTYSVEGPMARTIGDAALMLSVMAGPDDRSPISYDVDTRELLRAPKTPAVKGWRLAWTPDLGGLVEVDDEVKAIVERAVDVFASIGAEVEAACPDLGDVPEIVRLTRGLLMVARHADKLPQHRDALQKGLVENTEQGLAFSAKDVAAGELLRTRQWGRVREFLGDRDLMLTPTSATPPFPIETTPNRRSVLTYAFSVMGLPAISIPCGFTRAGLPVGLQIVGKRRGDAAVLRAAAAFEAAQPWVNAIPPVIPQRATVHRV